MEEAVELARVDVLDVLGKRPKALDDVFKDRPAGNGDFLKCHDHVGERLAKNREDLRTFSRHCREEVTSARPSEGGEDWSQSVTNAYGKLLQRSEHLRISGKNCQSPR